MRFLLDTNVISEVGKSRPNAKVMNWLLQHEANSGVPSIAIAERAQGICSMEEPKRTQLLKELKAWTQEHSEKIVAFDDEAAIVWGEYVQRPALRLNPKGVCDTQIAAIALSRNLILVTRNVDDFPEIQVLNPWD